MKKLLLLSALLIFACSSDSEGNPCIYEPTLSTEAVTDITETSATLNGIIAIVSENCDVALGEMQGFVYSTNPTPTNDDNVEVVYGIDISTTIDNLIPNTTYYVRVFITNSLGEFYGNEVSFVTEESIEPIDCDVVYLDDNGVTIKAYPCANIGDVGIVNGVEYTVVDNDMLYEMRGEFGQTITADFSKLCTTRLTDMSELFLCFEGFNQPIGNWDVSNVTNMSGMFYSECSASLFNQDISLWDVSNVTDMSYMFGGGAGNSNDRTFNQDISQWDVSNVTSMYNMFEGAASFNQPIGNWNVSNVTDMSYMFFYAQSYNQSILGWNTSNVTDMSYMFHRAFSFNQDTNNINTANVTNCTNFCLDATSWTLPKPNFSNCGEIGCN